MRNKSITPDRIRVTIRDWAAALLEKEATFAGAVIARPTPLNPLLRDTIVDLLSEGDFSLVQVIDHLRLCWRMDEVREAVDALAREGRIEVYLERGGEVANLMLCGPIRERIRG